MGPHGQGNVQGQPESGGPHRQVRTLDGRGGGGGVLLDFLLCFFVKVPQLNSETRMTASVLKQELSGTGYS